MPNENNRNERDEMMRGGEQGVSQGPSIRDDNRTQGNESTGGTRGGEMGGQAQGTAGGEQYGARGGEASRVTGGTQGAEGQPRPKQRRGFAAMDPAKQREIASKGGKASHEQGTGHEWDSESAREAGRKGGQASRGGRGKIRSPEGGAGGATGGGGGI